MVEGSFRTRFDEFYTDESVFPITRKETFCRDTSVVFRDRGPFIRRLRIVRDSFFRLVCCFAEFFMKNGRFSRDDSDFCMVKVWKRLRQKTTERRMK